MDPDTVNITISAANLLTLLGVARKIFRMEHKVDILWRRAGIEVEPSRPHRSRD